MIVPDKALAVHIKLVILKMHLRNNDIDIHVYDGDDYDEVGHDNCMVDQDTMKKCSEKRSPRDMIKFSKYHRSCRIALFNITHEFSKLRSALSNTPAITMFLKSVFFKRNHFNMFC